MRRRRRFSGDPRRPLRLRLAGFGRPVDVVVPIAATALAVIVNATVGSSAAVARAGALSVVTVFVVIAVAAALVAGVLGVG